MYGEDLLPSVHNPLYLVQRVHRGKSIDPWLPGGELHLVLFNAWAGEHYRVPGDSSIWAAAAMS